MLFLESPPGMQPFKHKSSIWVKTEGYLQGKFPLTTHEVKSIF